MRYISYITPIAFALALASCGSAPNGENMPEDLEGLRKLKTEKESQINQLSAEVAELEEAIAKLDTSLNGARKRLVTALAVPSKTFRHFVDVQGAVEAGEAVFASANIGGKLLRRPVKEGQQVRRGQLIAVIDTENIEKQKEELETSLQLARDIFTRQKSLWEQNIGSEVQYLQAKNNVERLEKSLQGVEATLRQAVVTAPISGIVNRVMLEPGEIAGPGSPIAEILHTGRVKVVADVPENYLGKISRGERIEISFPALGTTQEARVSLLGSSIDATNRTFKLEAELANSTGLLKPNLLAEIRFEDFSRENATVIPIELVQQEISGGDFVMGIDTMKGRFFAKKISVKTGRSYLGEILVEEGLSPGQQIIHSGSRNVSVGDYLQIEQSEERNGTAKQ